MKFRTRTVVESAIERGLWLAAAASILVTLGIIGVSGIPDAARLTYLGLYALQHRGQESAGIVAIDRQGQARSHRGMGLVNETFEESTLGTLPGDVAVGHTRYSTTGSTVLANAQPCNVGALTNLSGWDTGSNTFGGFVRARIQLGGTSPKGRVKVWLAGRGQQRPDQLARAAR